MKKFIALLMSSIMIILILIGCGKTQEELFEDVLNQIKQTYEEIESDTNQLEGKNTIYVIDFNKKNNVLTITEFENYENNSVVPDNNIKVQLYKKSYDKNIKNDLLAFDSQYKYCIVSRFTDNKININFDIVMKKYIGEVLILETKNNKVVYKIEKDDDESDD